MNTQELPKRISAFLLTHSLPGEEAQQLMAPSSRNPKLVRHHKSPRLSAVLILLYPKNEHWHLALIKRNSYKGKHSAQISLPGGKMEQEDSNLKACALRETFEEIGLHCDEDAVIGELSSLYIPISNFSVHPFVALIDYTPAFTPDPHEVNHIIELPLDTILDKRHQSHRDIISQEHHITSPVYQIKNGYIWGATAMILSEFAEILKQVKI